MRRQYRMIALVLAVATLSSFGGAGAGPRVIELSIRDGRLPEKERTVRVEQGDDITLRWTTDKPLTVHLHGYDIEKKLRPGTPIVMKFTARATGRFAIEIHGPGHGEERTLGYLEVHPR